MHRATAVNHAIDLIKLRIQSGTYNNANAPEILAELNQLADGLAKLNDSEQRSPQY